MNDNIAPKEYYLKQFNLEHDSDSLTLMSLKSENDGSMAFYHIFPGIDVVYNVFNTNYCVEGDFNMKSMDIIEINHCRQGRYGCMLNERMFYLGVNEIEANLLGIDRVNPEFPLGYYEGVEILIDVTAATEYLKPVFPDIANQIAALKATLESRSGVVSIKGGENVCSVFDELYNIDPASQASYSRLKTLEILSLLEPVPIGEGDKGHSYYRKSDFNKIKAIHRYIISNLDEKITLNELSQKYSISMTTLKNCFKEVYGCPYYTYIKRYKMHKAVHFLEETDLTISEIAGRLGYDNTSKFIAAFKSIINCTPKQYKNKNVRLEHLKLFGVEIE